MEEIDKIVEAHKFSRSNVTSDLERDLRVKKLTTKRNKPSQLKPNRGMDDGDECLREIIKYFPLLSTTTTSAALT